MTDTYGAPVFNRSEADFMVSAEAIRPGVSMTREPGEVIAQLNRQAPGLSSYIDEYLKEVVAPLNDKLEATGLQRYNPSMDYKEFNAIIFAEASLMTLRMIDGVYQNTGAELPPMAGKLGEVALGSTDMKAEEKPLLDAYFRGRELHDRLPHVYRAVVALMEGRTGLPAAELEADLAVPLARHRDAVLGIRELHFMGGAAETVLVMEDSTR